MTAETTTPAGRAVHFRPEHRRVVCGVQVRDPQRVTTDPEQVTCGGCTRTDAHNYALGAQINRRNYEEFYKPAGTAEQFGMADWRIHQRALVSLESMAREFHTTLNVHGGWMPSEPTADIPAGLPELRQVLLDEEVGELREAAEAADVVKIADALAGIAYVIAGTAITYGIPLDAVLREVHRSNMTKVNDPDKAKLVKGPGYEPPRIAELLAIMANGKRAERKVS